MTDLTFRTEEGCFSCRVGAIVIRRGRVLLMKNPEEPYFYTVGGRIRFDETALEAVEREALEETGLPLKAERPLFFLEQFYEFCLNGDAVHEIGFYYLMKDDAALDDLKPGKAGAFSRTQRGASEELVWVPLEDLSKYRIVPEAVSERLRDLPLTTEWLVARER